MQFLQQCHEQILQGFRWTRLMFHDGLLKLWESYQVKYDQIEKK